MIRYTMMNTLEAILSDLKAMGPLAVILFGSVARGEQGRDSDIDILVVKETSKPFSQRSREMRSAVKTNAALDIIVLTPKEARELPKKSSFFAQVFREGKVVYGRV